MNADTPRPAVPRLVWIATVAAVTAGLVFLWFTWCVFPISDWNEVRLAPAFALRHGLTVYAPSGGGPLSTWIYGPLTIVLNLPATFAPSATSAIQTANAINTLTVVIPLVLVCWTVDRLRDAPWAYRACALALCVLFLPAATLTFQVADNAAVACGLISCWCLTRPGTPYRLPAVAAAWCVLSICAKQNAVFLLVAQLIYLRAFTPRGNALRHLLWVAALGLPAALACGAYFGFANMWLNLVTIPSRVPWGALVDKIALRWPHLLVHLVTPFVLLLLWRRSAFWPARESSLGRSVRCNVIAFVTFLPIGFLSFFKVGGDTNVFHSHYYLQPLLVATFVAHAGTSAAGPRWLLAVAAAAVALRWPEFRELPSQPLTAHLTQASLVAAKAPQSTWFPNNPVVTFYSDGKLYNVEDGLATRHLAGIGIREVDFRRHLPAPLTTIVYDVRVTSPFALQLLSEFTLASRTGRWALYQKASSARAP